MELTRINNDVNGNPRYVVHFLEIPMTAAEQAEIDNPTPRVGKYGEIIKDTRFSIQRQYDLAVAKAHKIGGRRFSNKQYGGGIVFQSYDTDNLIKNIQAL